MPLLNGDDRAAAAGGARGNGDISSDYLLQSCNEALWAIYLVLGWFMGGVAEHMVS